MVRNVKADSCYTYSPTASFHLGINYMPRNIRSIFQRRKGNLPNALCDASEDIQVLSPEIENDFLQYETRVDGRVHIELTIEANASSDNKLRNFHSAEYNDIFSTCLLLF